MTVVADQGGGNIPAALFCMSHLQLRMVYLNDPHHRSYNDWKNAMHEQGQWGCILDAVVAAN
eukprot:5288713-Amphidinium_carterae.1